MARSPSVLPLSLVLLATVFLVCAAVPDLAQQQQQQPGNKPVVRSAQTAVDFEQIFLSLETQKPPQLASAELTLQTAAALVGNLILALNQRSLIDLVPLMAPRCRLVEYFSCAQHRFYSPEKLLRYWDALFNSLVLLRVDQTSDILIWSNRLGLAFTMQWFVQGPSKCIVLLSTRVMLRLNPTTHRMEEMTFLQADTLDTWGRALSQSEKTVPEDKSVLCERVPPPNVEAAKADSSRAQLRLFWALLTTSGLLVPSMDFVPFFTPNCILETNESVMRGSANFLEQYLGKLLQLFRSGSLRSPGPVDLVFAGRYFGHDIVLCGLFDHSDIVCPVCFRLRASGTVDETGAISSLGSVALYK